MESTKFQPLKTYTCSSVPLERLMAEKNVPLWFGYAQSSLQPALLDALTTGRDMLVAALPESAALFNANLPVVASAFSEQVDRALPYAEPGRAIFGVPVTAFAQNADEKAKEIRRYAVGHDMSLKLMLEAGGFSSELIVDAVDREDGWNCVILEKDAAVLTKDEKDEWAKKVLGRAEREAGRMARELKIDPLVAWLFHRDALVTDRDMGSELIQLPSLPRGVDPVLRSKQDRLRATLRDMVMTAFEAAGDEYTRVRASVIVPIIEESSVLHSVNTRAGGLRPPCPPTPGGGPWKWTASMHMRLQMCMDGSPCPQGGRSPPAPRFTVNYRRIHTMFWLGDL